MKRRFLSIVLALALLCALLPAGMVQAAEGRSYPAVSDNQNRQDYSVCASPVSSHLFENGSGGLTRVELTPMETSLQYVDGDWVETVVQEAGLIVEDYTPEFSLQASHRIDLELDQWGGFFAGEAYNFFIFGQSNPEEDDEKEVIRVVKYSKDWKRLGAASLYGANTYIPFDAGSLRCAEYGGMLYIRTCHEMYASPDGLHHQANLTMAVRERDMAVTDSFHLVAGSGAGYVSHSFNQFVIVDSNRRIVSVDHGDAYPRSIVLMTWSALAGAEKITGSVQATTIQEFPGAIGANYTGASVGGLAETGSGYVVAYNLDGDDNGGITTRRVYLAYVDKETNAVTTTAVSNPGADTPVLAPTGPDGGYLLWNAHQNDDTSLDDTLYYARYSADGTVGAVKTAKGGLSDCQPIVYRNKVVWYATDDSVPVFYQLDKTGLSVAPSAYAVQVSEAEGGSVTAGQAWAEAGEKITLTVTPDRGFVAQGRA